MKLAVAVVLLFAAWVALPAAPPERFDVANLIARAF
jgi:hypothetical protein